MRTQPWWAGPYEQDSDPELRVCQVGRVATTPTLGPDPDLSDEAINSGTECGEGFQAGWGEGLAPQGHFLGALVVLGDSSGIEVGAPSYCS